MANGDNQEDVVTTVPEFEGVKQVLSTDEVQVLLDSYNMTAEQVIVLYEGIRLLEQIIGLPLNRLQTASKDSIVDAINSVLSEVDINTIVGPLYELTTGDKTSVVAAINWLNADKTSWDDFSTYFRSFFSVQTREEFQAKLAPWQITQVEGLQVIINELNSGKVSWSDFSPFIQIFVAASTKRAAQDTLTGWEIDDITGLQDALNLKANASDLPAKEDKANKGAVDGYAPLNSNRQVPVVNMPPQAITITFTANSDAAMTALSATQGDLCLRPDSGKTFMLSQEPASVLTNWTFIAAMVGGVSSVDGMTGAVDLSPKYIVNADNKVTRQHWEKPASTTYPLVRMWLPSSSNQYFVDTNATNAKKFFDKGITTLAANEVLDGTAHGNVCLLSGTPITLFATTTSNTSASTAIGSQNIFNGWRTTVKNITDVPVVISHATLKIDGNNNLMIAGNSSLDIIFDGANFRTALAGDDAGGGVISVDGQTGIVNLTNSYIGKSAHPSIGNYATGLFALPFTDTTFQEYSLKDAKKYIDSPFISITEKLVLLDGSQHGKTISLDYIPSSSTIEYGNLYIDGDTQITSLKPEELANNFNGIFAGWEITLINNCSMDFVYSPDYPTTPPYIPVIKYTFSSPYNTETNDYWPVDWYTKNDQAHITLSPGQSIKIRFDGNKFLTEYNKPRSISIDSLQMIKGPSVLGTIDSFGAVNPVSMYSLSNALKKSGSPSYSFQAIRNTTDSTSTIDYYDIDVSEYFSQSDMNSSNQNNPLIMNLIFDSANASTTVYLRFKTSTSPASFSFSPNYPNSLSGPKIGTMMGTAPIAIMNPRAGYYSPYGWQLLDSKSFGFATYSLIYSIPPAARMLRIQGYSNAFFSNSSSPNNNTMMQVSFDNRDSWCTNNVLWWMTMNDTGAIYGNGSSYSQALMLSGISSNATATPVYSAILHLNAENRSVPMFQSDSSSLTEHRRLLMSGYAENNVYGRGRVTDIKIFNLNGMYFNDGSYICIEYIC